MEMGKKRKMKLRYQLADGDGMMSHSLVPRTTEWAFQSLVPMGKKGCFVPISDIVLFKDVEGVSSMVIVP